MTMTGVYLTAILTLFTGAQRVSKGVDQVVHADWDRKLLVTVNEFETLVRAVVMAAKNNGEQRQKTGLGNRDFGKNDVVSAVVPPLTTIKSCDRSRAAIDGPVTVSTARDIVSRVMDNIKKMHKKWSGTPVLTVHYNH